MPGARSVGITFMPTQFREGSLSVRTSPLRYLYHTVLGIEENPCHFLAIAIGGTRKHRPQGGEERWEGGIRCMGELNHTEIDRCAFVKCKCSRESTLHAVRRDPRYPHINPSCLSGRFLHNGQGWC